MDGIHEMVAIGVAPHLAPVPSDSIAGPIKNM
jgi:hypothetical protein